MSDNDKTDPDNPSIIHPSRPATMHDVAARVGVSVATVSRALNGNRPMSPALRQNVLEAAEALNYRINLVGRALRQRRTSTVGLVVPDLENPFFSSLAQSLSRTFLPTGIDLYIFSADNDLGAEMRGLQSFIGRQVNSLIVVPCHNASTPAINMAASSVPTIQVDRRVPSTSTHFVGCNNAFGIRLVRDHIAADVDIERQPIIFVGPSNESSSGRERLSAFKRWFPGRPVILGGFDVTFGQSAADQILTEGFRSATIVTGADIIALGLLSRLHALGHRVPQDFRVIGFDGIGISQLAQPTLTTVRQPIETISQSVLRLVNDCEVNPNAAISRTTFKPRLVYGESSPQAT